MEKFLNKFFMMLVALVLATGIASCGDDDEPSYDPENPYLGTWVVSEVSGWHYRPFLGQLLLDEEQSAREFTNKWLNKTIKINAKTKVEDNKIIYDESSSRNIFIEYFEVVDVTENTMSVRYVYEDYLSSGNYSSITTASMLFTRK